MPTYKLISSVTVGAGGQSAIEFTNIPATYTDLQLVVTARSIRVGAERDSMELSFNSNTSGYSGKTVNGNGATAGSNTCYGTASINRMDVNGATSTSNSFSNIAIYIPNYTSSNNKSVSVDSVYEDNTTNAFQYLIAGLWSNSAAITSIKLGLEIGPTFVQYSSAYLYGISNA